MRELIALFLLSTPVLAQGGDPTLFPIWEFVETRTGGCADPSVGYTPRFDHNHYSCWMPPSACPPIRIAAQNYVAIRWEYLTPSAPCIAIADISTNFGVHIAPCVNISQAELLCVFTSNASGRGVTTWRLPTNNYANLPNGLHYVGRLQVLCLHQPLFPITVSSFPTNIFVQIP